jgi:hypothetical protein
MKKIILLLTILSSHISIHAQKLEDCSLCASKKYTISDISQNELYEIQLLRNEIFARHHYPFKNERLGEYYTKYTWYKPNDKISIQKINLNSIELANIDLFKARERDIQTYRKQLINELKKLKIAINTSNISFIEKTFNKVASKNDDIYPALIKALRDVLNAADLEDINWHKGQAQYVVTLDNGYSISTRRIYIKENFISIINSDPEQHSTLMRSNEAFKYPSSYFSENENTGGGKFEFKNGKLILVALLFAG